MFQKWKTLFNARLTGKTTVPSKSALDVESGGSLDVKSGGSLKLAGTEVTATAAELNRSTDISARIVTTTATSLNLTLTEHAERLVVINTNSTVANTFTLPLATGSGAKMTLVNNIAQTQGSIVIAANGTTNTLKGMAYIVSSTEEAAICAFTTATDDKLTMNRTTTGGLGGDIVEAWDIETGVWHVQARLNGNGSVATPFAAT